MHTTYSSMKVNLVRSTEQPLELIKQVCNVSMKKVNIDETAPDASAKLVEYLYKANHQTPLEFATMTFAFENVSSAFLAQITRHRTGTFMSSSQHYQNYSEYPMVMSEQAWKNDLVHETLHSVLSAYDTLVRGGMPVEEARMILPQACTRVIYWQVNARNLAHFLNLRLCRRNVEEMSMAAEAVWNLAMGYLPELFMHVGPDCMFGKCSQGKLSCGRPYPQTAKAYHGN